MIPIFDLLINKRTPEIINQKQKKLLGRQTCFIWISCVKQLDNWLQDKQNFQLNFTHYACLLYKDEWLEEFIQNILMKRNFILEISS